MFAFHSSLGQQGWTNISANLPPSVTQVNDAFFIGDTGWITGMTTGLVNFVGYTTDGGNSFTLQNFPANSGLIQQIFMRSTHEGYCVTSRTSIGVNVYHSTDPQNGGGTLMPGSPGVSLYGISFPPLPDTIGYCSSGAGDVYRIGTHVTFDAHITSDALTSICFPVSSDEGWVLGGTTIRHRIASGWVIDQNYSSGRDYTSLYFKDNTHGWASGEDGSVIYTTDGKNWVIEFIDPGQRSFNDVCFSDIRQGWVVGQGGLIFHTTDGGLNWDPAAGDITNSNMMLISVFATPDQTVYVTGTIADTIGVLLKYTSTSGTGEPEMQNFSIYPNPCSDVLYLQFNQPEKNFQISVLNLYGEEVKRIENTNAQRQISMGNLVSGAYFLRMENDKQIIMKKFCVVR